ncbi:hypothetical protein [Microbulbifer spongiae]|uniref:DUF3168 domain-containing protein n=1 Tax=Microbulbifer spongiae TaxID=2944933 RepID=A0ABY9EIV8_9GAMM|nr:hypothetical protein [Microbulbifer sp. MI-G]WKD51680.1 hypothetical protein M8T91_18670 [Microbulbifer sp. MI-G]
MGQRIAIRDAVNVALQTLQDYTLIAPGTTDEIPESSLPALVVGFATEATQHELYGGSERQLEITVAAVVKSRGDVYAALDRAAADIESALTDNTLGGAERFLLSQTQFALDTEQPLGEVRLIYAASYSTGA